jgi:hypothetical protein
MIPTIARQLAAKVFLLPDGKRILVTPLSGSCATTRAYPPEALANLPQSPECSSILQTTVPSGIDPNGMMLPIVKSADYRKRT